MLRDLNRKKLIRLLGFLLALAVFYFNFTPGMCAVRELTDAIFVERGEALPSPPLSSAAEGAVTVSDSGDETLSGRRLRILLFGFIELKSIPVCVSERAMLIPGGNAVGISIHTDGVLIVGFGEVYDSSGNKCCPAKDSSLRAGDLIISANGIPVYTAEELQQALNESHSRARLSVRRDGKLVSVSVTPAVGSGGDVKLGAWVRDSTVGIGTLSFVIAESGGTAALGHSVVDADTGCILPVRSGELRAASILGVTKGRSGIPGELRGTVHDSALLIGSIISNSELGVFGLLEAQNGAQSPAAAETLPLAFPTEVHEGDAELLAQIDSEGVKSYSCKIIRVSKQDRPDQKGLVIEITDSRLLVKTGGIVQGMSGSPIIQDGRLAGVVTHVFVNDPTRGYGVYAYWMYEACRKAS